MKRRLERLRYGAWLVTRWDIARCVEGIGEVMRWFEERGGACIVGRHTRSTIVVCNMGASDTACGKRDGILVGYMWRWGTKWGGNYSAQLWHRSPGQSTLAHT